jgi:hypothetical protein
MATTTSLDYFALGATTVNNGSATFGAGYQLGFPTGGGAIAASTIGPIYPLPTYRYSLASTTTIYLTANVSFSVSTCKGYGIIQARRVR